MVPLRLLFIRVEKRESGRAFARRPGRQLLFKLKESCLLLWKNCITRL